MTVFIARDPASCWRVFTDASTLALWVPGLRRAQVIAKDKGLPSEVHFEFSASLAYTLAYDYDLERREIRWEPKLGKRDGVSGLARFTSGPDGGTDMTYQLTHGAGRVPQDRSLGDPQALVNAFVAWMHDERS